MDWPTVDAVMFHAGTERILSCLGTRVCAHFLNSDNNLRTFGAVTPVTGQEPTLEGRAWAVEMRL